MRCRCGSRRDVTHRDRARWVAEAHGTPAAPSAIVAGNDVPLAPDSGVRPSLLPSGADMANHNQASFAKRQRESAKRAKRQEKDAKRAQRTADRAAIIAAGGDPDA